MKGLRIDMKNDFNKACETFAAVSLGIDDDNVKLEMWKELLNKLSDNNIIEENAENLEKVQNVADVDNVSDGISENMIADENIPDSNISRGTSENISETSKDKDKDNNVDAGKDEEVSEEKSDVTQDSENKESESPDENAGHSFDIDDDLDNVNSQSTSVKNADNVEGLDKPSYNENNYDDFIKSSDGKENKESETAGKVKTEEPADNNKEDSSSEEDTFEIDDDLDDWDDSSKEVSNSDKTEETSETLNKVPDTEDTIISFWKEGDIVPEGYVKNKAEGTIEKDINYEMKKWTGNHEPFSDNSIKEFPSPVSKDWKFYTGVQSKKAGKLVKVYGEDRAVYFYGDRIANADSFYLDKNGDYAGEPDEMCEFLSKGIKLKTIDENDLKRLNINSLDEFGKAMKVTPFLKNYSVTLGVPPERVKSQDMPAVFETDIEAYEREKKYALLYARCYNAYQDVMDSYNEGYVDKGCPCPEWADISRSNEYQRIAYYDDRMSDRDTMVDTIEKLAIKFPNVISLLWLILTDKEVYSEYLPNVSFAVFSENPMRLFDRSDKHVPNDEAQRGFASREALTANEWRKILCYITKRSGNMWYCYPPEGVLQKNKSF